MLKVQEIDETVVSIDYPAPSVYIDRCYINPGGNISVHYHIADEFNQWYNDKNLIDA